MPSTTRPSVKAALVPYYCTLVCSFMVLGCFSQSNFVKVPIESRSQSSLQDVRLGANLNDSNFTLTEINRFISVNRSIYPVTVWTEREDSLSAVLRTLKRPVARVVVSNIAKVPLFFPSGMFGKGVGRIDDFELCLIYQFGKEGNDSVLNMPSRSDYRLFTHQPNYFVKLKPHDSALIEDSLDFIVCSDGRQLESGRYWLVFYYQNFFTKKGQSDYWIGRIQSDTLWFRIEDN